MAKIFLSHSHRDEGLAKVLVSEIGRVLGLSEEAIETDIFRSSSPYAIRIGDKWLDRVFEALNSADVLIPLVTPSSEKSMWVAFEYGYFWRRTDRAKKRKKREPKIFPLVHTINPASPLNELECRPVTDKAELEEFFKDLCEYFDRKFKQPDLEAIAQQASRIPRLTAEDQQLQLICKLYLMTATAVDAKKSIIRWMKEKDILHDAQFDWIGDLQQVDFTSANMQRINLGGDKNNLTKANFTKADLENAHLGSTTLHNADFHHAILRGASLHSAKLQGADFREAILCGADLRSAQLQGAIFQRDNQKAELDDKTRLPNEEYYRPDSGLEQMKAFGAIVD